MEMTVWQVAKNSGGATAAKQVAYLWAKSLGGDSAVKLLAKFGLVDAAIEYASENWWVYCLCQLGKSHLYTWDAAWNSRKNNMNSQIFWNFQPKKQLFGFLMYFNANYLLLQCIWLCIWACSPCKQKQITWNPSEARHVLGGWGEVSWGWGRVHQGCKTKGSSPYVSCSFV